MVQAPDFDRKMLLLATQLAHESDMKGLLLSVLDALLQTLSHREGNNITEAMIIIRCSIRLILNLLAEPAANQYVINTPIRSIAAVFDYSYRLVLVNTLLEHFVTGEWLHVSFSRRLIMDNEAAALVNAASADQKSTIITKDISWLWRTAYNSAVQGCSDWGNTELQVTGLFHIAAEVIFRRRQRNSVINPNTASYCLLRRDIGGTRGRCLCSCYQRLLCRNFRPRY